MAAAYAPRHRRDGAAELGLVPTRVVVAAAVLVVVGVAVVVATR